MFFLLFAIFRQFGDRHPILRLNRAVPYPFALTFLHPTNREHIKRYTSKHGYRFHFYRRILGVKQFTMITRQIVINAYPRAFRVFVCPPNAKFKAISGTLAVPPTAIRIRDNGRFLSLLVFPYLSFYLNIVLTVIIIYVIYIKVIYHNFCVSVFLLDFLEFIYYF